MNFIVALCLLLLAPLALTLTILLRQLRRLHLPAVKKVAVLAPERFPLQNRN